MTDIPDLTSVLAANARALRGTARIDDVARAARRYGAHWSPNRVWDLEQGKVPPTVPTLITLALALGDVHGRKFTLADLLASDENVVLLDDLLVTGDELAGFLRGDEVVHDYSALLAKTLRSTLATLKLREDWPPRLQRIKHGLLMEVYRDYGAAEEYLARDLGLDQDRLVAEMCALWGRSFHAERDAIAGPGVTKQKRGRVSRTLKAQLKAVLDGDDQ